MRKYLIAFALVASMGTAMAGDLCNPCQQPAPVCPAPEPVCLPFTKKVAVNPCNPCETVRVAVECPNIWGKIFGARHTPTAE